MFTMEMKRLHYLLYLSVGLLNVPLITATFKIRLAGSTQCSGRVEVFHDETWGTVCDDYWGIANAEVACRELNCGSALEAKRQAFFGEGKEEIWLDDVKCTGKESSLNSCPHKDFGDNNCGHNEDAGVVCSESIRLINGTSRCSGRVEVKHNGQWRKVCDSGWSKKETQVLCQELRCGVPDDDHGLISFGQGSGTVGFASSCSGNESSLANCNLQERNESCVDVSVVCQNNKVIRLANGTGRCSGRVEVYHEDQWGTVCDDRWGMQEAEVVCREMNCGNPLDVKTRAYFGEGSDRVWLDDIGCLGNEKSLGTCPHRGFGENDCSHAEDAGVVCSETLRLLNGTNRCSGRLEIYQDGKWGTICSSAWTMKEATVVCQELECGKPLTITVNSNVGPAQGLRKYTSSCTGNVSSIAQCSFQLNPSGCEDVSLICAGIPTLRLANGTDRCSGRVEVNHDGRWGTVCDDEWDIRDAQVVCRAMDCGTAQQAKSRAFFGQGTGEIWLDDVGCLGNEMSLDHCQRAAVGENNCGHSEDAGVICASNIRLINGTDQCSGRVEVYHNGQWSPVYEQNWGLKETAVVCREMDCGDPATAQGSSPFGQGSGARGYTVSCSGKEASLAQCSLSEFPKTSHDGVGDATIVCSGNLKLVNGSGPCAGRVEYYHSGYWGTVCSESWDMNDAAVVCRQLNCGRAHVATHMGYFGHGSGNVWIDQLECQGSETSLSHCTQRELGYSRCNQTSAAGVICSESLGLRLVGGNDHCSGRVEVNHAGRWGTVCGRDWTMANAEVVCKLLDCGSAYSPPGGAHFEEGTGPVWEASDACFGSEKGLNQCIRQGFNETTCDHAENAGAICAAKLRLVDGKGECSGRVEIFYNGQWGTVCDDEWRLPSAIVVCRQLGCGAAISAPTNAHFGSGTGPIWLDNVECNGDESTLTQCTHLGFGENNCGHSEDASVVCFGALSKPHITLSPASEVSWGERVEFTCTIETEQLGGTFILEKTAGSFRLEKYTDQTDVTFVILKADFDHTGSYRCLYRKRLSSQTINYPQGEPVKLSVAVSLHQPSISLTSPHAMVIFSPDKLEVSKGNFFSITCSVQSQFPGGYFYLTKSNGTTGPPKPAFGHSAFFLAYFEFVASYEVQGEYSCVYGVNISENSFCSTPSKSVVITVVASSVTPVVSGVLGGLLLLLLLLVVCYLVWRRRQQSGPAMVMYSNRTSEGAKEDNGKKAGTLDGGDYNLPANEYGNGHGVEEKNAEVDSQNAVESPTDEDLTGRVCFELEPLIHS